MTDHKPTYTTRRTTLASDKPYAASPYTPPAVMTTRRTGIKAEPKYIAATPLSKRRVPWYPTVIAMIVIVGTLLVSYYSITTMIPA